MGIRLETNASASYSQELLVSFPNYIALLLPINRQNILQLRFGTGLFGPQPVMVTTKVMMRNLGYPLKVGQFYVQRLTAVTLLTGLLSI